jgi:hypothetical protein
MRLSSNSKTSKILLGKWLAWIVILLLLVSPLIFYLPTSEGIHKKTFSDNSLEKSIVFPSGGGIDETVNVSIIQGTSISYARMNITPTPISGEYPLDVHLDVGRDNDFEWAYSGPGYGHLGLQTSFNDSSTNINKEFLRTSDIISTSIKLPKTATINNAVMNITGEFREKSIITQVDPNLGPPYACELADMDGDNNMDVVVTYRQQTSPFPTHLSWFNNTAGDGSTWVINNITTSGLIIPYGLDVGDLDGDGDMDVVANSHSASRAVYWYNNTDGKGTTWSTHIINNSIVNVGSMMYALVIADMNNDSYNDVVSIITNSVNTQEDIFWFSNTNGDGSAWTTHVINKTTNGARNIFIADMDGDGDNDTVCSTQSWTASDEIAWFSNDNGIGTSWSKYLINNTVADPFAVAVGDIDNDTNPDIGVLGSVEISWFRAPNNPTVVSAWSKHDIATSTTNTGGEIVIADMGYNYENKQPDNYLDIIVAHRSFSDVIIYKNDGTPLDGGWDTFYLNTEHDWPSYMAVDDIDGDSYNDTIVTSAVWTTTDDLMWYRYWGDAPSNVELNLGADIQADWVHPGRLNYTTQVTDFTTNLTQYLTQTQSYFDEYGNELVVIPLTVDTETTGVVTLNELQIDFDWTATVDVNPAGNLATELTEALSTTLPDEYGNSTVTFKFISNSGGRLRLHDLIIEYNEFPWFISELPETIYLPEDSKDLKLLDLSTFVADDYITATELTYNITYVSGPGADHVHLTIEDSYYLGADALTGWQNDNWTGYLDFVLTFTDNYGSMLESNSIRLEVTPVNDEPILGDEAFPELIIPEGGTSNPFNLAGRNYFIDVDNDPLHFEAELDPLNIVDNENITFELNKANNEMIFTGLGDYFAENIPVRIYCDDSEPVNKTLYRDIPITILNLNDAPKWKVIPDFVFLEDTVQLDAIKLSDYVTDTDDSVENITFSLVSNSNSENIRVIINEDSMVDIYPTTSEYAGNAIVTIRATDPGQNYSDQSFNIIYLPVNDPPEIELLTPTQNSVVASETVILTWRGFDVDSPKENISFNLFFGDSMPPSAHDQATGLVAEHFDIPDLQNKVEYYWRVLATDGDQSTLSEVFSFTVDVGNQPRVKLISPQNNAIFPETFVTFDWEVTFAGIEDLVFDFYFDTNEDPIPNGQLHSNLTISELTIYDLAPDTSYYWTVLPRFYTGYGLCDSGVYKFSIDQSKIAFGIEINPAETEIKLTKGNSHSFDVEFLNLGTSDEIVTISLSPQNISNNVEFLHGETLSISSENSRTIEFKIDSSNLLKGRYTLTIQAKSKVTPAIKTKEISIEILDPESKDDTEGIFTSAFDFLPIILIIILAVLGFLIIFRYKPKYESEYEEVGDLIIEKGLPGRDGTEILYKPSMDSISPAGWQPAIGTGVTDEEQPQLPPLTLTPDYTPEQPTISEEAPELTPTIEPTFPDEMAEDTGPQVMLPEDLDLGTTADTTSTVPPAMDSEPDTSMVDDVLLPETELPEPDQDVLPEDEKLGLLPDDIPGEEGTDVEGKAKPEKSDDGS